MVNILVEVKKTSKIAKNTKNRFSRDTKVGNWKKTWDTAGKIWGLKKANCWKIEAAKAVNENCKLVNKAINNNLNNWKLIILTFFLNSNSFKYLR